MVDYKKFDHIGDSDDEHEEIIHCEFYGQLTADQQLKLALTLKG